MQKVKTNQLTAGMLSKSFKESVKSFVAKDEAYNFMNNIKDTPACWHIEPSRYKKARSPGNEIA